MTQEVQIHETNMHMVQSAPAQVDAGADIALKVGVSCPHACDLRGKTVRILAQDNTIVKEIALTSFQAEINKTDEFMVQAPIALGECAWSVVFPAQEIGEVLHESSSTPVKFNVKPHTASIAIWDFPSPAIMNSEFEIKIGVKCSAECQLKGMKVDVCDGKGTQVATGTLGETPWAKTSGLYWAEVRLASPCEGGRVLLDCQLSDVRVGTAARRSLLRLPL